MTRTGLTNFRTTALLHQAVCLALSPQEGSVVFCAVRTPLCSCIFVQDTANSLRASPYTCASDPTCSWTLLRYTHRITQRQVLIGSEIARSGRNSGNVSRRVRFSCSLPNSSPSGSSKVPMASLVRSLLAGLFLVGIAQARPAEVLAPQQSAVEIESAGAAHITRMCADAERAALSAVTAC